MAKPMLTLAEIRSEWSKTYNTVGKPEWAHIFPYYAEEIIFHDSIQQIEGKSNFQAMCNRLTKRCKSLKMDIYDISQTDRVVMMEWKMTMAFRFFPEKAIYGLTKLTFNDEGLISHQRDYYDLWGDIYDGIPGVRIAYRWFMRKFFG
ncbi:MAG: DUF2358 domain-containing protein [Culicoidibacterales bacterium]